MTDPGAPPAPSLDEGSSTAGSSPTGPSEVGAARWSPLPAVERCQVCGGSLANPAGCYACAPQAAPAGDQGVAARPTAQVRPMGLALTEVLRGVGYLPRGAWFLLRTPRLWKLATIPLLINLAAVVLAWVAAHYLLAPWLQRATGPEAFADWNGWLWGSLAWAIGWVGWAVGLVAQLLVPILATWLLVAFPLGILYKLLFVPFMEALGAAADGELLGAGGTSLRFETRRFAILWGMLDAIVLGLLQGLLLLALIPINLIPLLGSVVWLILPPAIFASMDFSDLHLVRRDYTTREKLRLWWAHQWRFLGYGASFCFFLTIPVLNALVIPAATVGGAMLYLELDRK
ncbi:MAG: EI24 domain-containing protein [Planctomycetota bacterium]